VPGGAGAGAGAGKAPAPAPGASWSSRTVHLEMVGALLAGSGLERVAEIAGAHAGAPVAVILPRRAAPPDRWIAYERYVEARLAGRRRAVRRR
jgi:hypothetical protein